MINKLPDSNPSSLDLQNAKAFTSFLIDQVEKACIAEIEKLEGKIPSERQFRKHAVERFDKITGFTQYLWKGILLVTVKPNQIDENGKRGTMLEIHKVVEPEDAE